MSERRVWIAQMLCGPQRHAILAGACEAENSMDAMRSAGRDVANQILEWIREGRLHPWCSICGAPQEQWQLEVGCSMFRTMEEALPALAEIQAENIAANILLGGHPGPGKTN